MISSPPRHRFYNSQASTRRRGNPYFTNKKTDRFGSSIFKNFLANISPRNWLWFFIIIIILVVLAWLLLFSNVLVIKNIEVRGNSIISSADIESIAREHLTKNRFLVLVESRLAVFDTEVLKQEISERYPLDKIQISRKIPSTIIITLTEKIPAAVWFEADYYQEVDASGWILALVNGNIDGLPTIYNNGWPRISNKKIDGAEPIIAFAKILTPEFNNRFSLIKIKQLAVDNDQATIKLIPERGAMIYFSTSDDLLTQLDRLDLLLRSELKGRFEKMRYIDLRFGDKVYYQ